MKISQRILPGGNVLDSVVDLFSLGLSLVLPVVTGSLVVDSEEVSVVETGSG